MPTYFNFSKAASGSLDALSRYLMHKAGQQEEDKRRKEDDERWQQRYGADRDEARAERDRIKKEQEAADFNSWVANKILPQPPTGYQFGPGGATMPIPQKKETPKSFEAAILEALYSGDEETLKRLMATKQQMFKETPEESGDPIGTRLMGMDEDIRKIRSNQMGDFGKARYYTDAGTLDEYLANRGQQGEVRNVITDHLLNAYESGTGPVVLNEALSRHGRENIDPRFQYDVAPVYDDKYRGAVPLVSSGVPEGQEKRSWFTDRKANRAAGPMTAPETMESWGAKAYPGRWENLPEEAKVALWNKYGKTNPAM